MPFILRIGLETCIEPASMNAVWKIPQYLPRLLMPLLFCNLERW